ncbi:hypothetical protein MTO98_15745 [Mucilaginibacter sp. SMC90]|uniref:hypothetical protein n=1 Tax=Mucilaginibacter sp. SMC90 TaxID=2929803 RepID=UPI001FB3EF55|nr:hypothetical protein [Mucilaginibacter sp. SMC90]UOE52529.1 hypothetical protein MTO98_15745 [Mucilaginibacter sp. SMC90]
MKNYIKIIRKYLSILLLLLMTGTVKVASAQCAQCVATVESNRQSGNDALAKGLNNGIIYLLCMPYAAIAIVGFVWYRKFRKKAITLSVPSEKLNLN